MGEGLEGAWPKGIDLCRYFKGKGLGGLAKQLGFLFAVAIMLAGCTRSFEQWQSDAAKTKADFAHMHTEEQERDNYTACVEQGILPGTPENLTCQLDLAKKEQQPAKPQNPPANAP